MLLSGAFLRSRSVLCAVATCSVVSLLAVLGFLPGTPPLVRHSSHGGYFIPATTVIAPGTSRYNRACDASQIERAQESWVKIMDKYKHLREDKFTIAMQTYQRPEGLAKILKVLTEAHVPSLHEIVVVWNDLETEPWDDYIGQQGVPVRFRQSKKNSLNARLWPDPEFATQAILLSDDDLYLQPDDLEFAFQTWRLSNGTRLTGVMPRCTGVDSNGDLVYDYCDGWLDEHTPYALIITNLAFAHISLLDFYSSDHAAMKAIRAYVDDHMNCEDIGFNYAQSLVQRVPPLMIQGHEDRVKVNGPTGLSKAKDWTNKRSACLNEFVDLVGCMPLMNTTMKMVNGRGT